MSPTRKRLGDEIAVDHCAAQVPISLELPAPVCVCSLLAAAALAKGEHWQWAIGGITLLYLLYVAAQYAKWAAFRPRILAVLRLITNSNLEGRITGRSAAFSPVRSGAAERSVYLATRTKRHLPSEPRRA
jgi:hypothetical protein